MHLDALVHAYLQARELVSLDVAQEVDDLEARVLLLGRQVQAIDAVHRDEHAKPESLFEQLRDVRNLIGLDDAPGIAGAIDISLDEGLGQLVLNLVQREGAHVMEAPGGGLRRTRRCIGTRHPSVNVNSFGEIGA